MSETDPQHWQRVKEIFQGALERHAADRVSFLDRECGAQADVREEVESLLRSYEVAGSFMESPAVAQAADALAGAEQRLTPGQRVKHYQIVSLTGEGGMGEVYLATDTILGRRSRSRALPVFRQQDPEAAPVTQISRGIALSLRSSRVLHGETDDGRPFIDLGSKSRHNATTSLANKA